MLRTLLVTLALVSATYAVQCYSGCVAGKIVMAGAEQGYPGGECTDETVMSCEDGCATISLVFDYTMAVEDTEMNGSADAKTAMCSMGAANDNLCSTMQSSLKSTMGAVKNLKCNVATCNTDKCNDPAKSMDEGKGGEDGASENGGEDGADTDSSSLAVQISAVLLSAVFGYLF